MKRNTKDVLQWFHSSVQQETQLLYKLVRGVMPALAGLKPHSSASPQPGLSCPVQWTLTSGRGAGHGGGGLPDLVSTGLPELPHQATNREGTQSYSSADRPEDFLSLQHPPLDAPLDRTLPTKAPRPSSTTGGPVPAPSHQDTQTSL